MFNNNKHYEQRSKQIELEKKTNSSKNKKHQKLLQRKRKTQNNSKSLEELEVVVNF